MKIQKFLLSLGLMATPLVAKDYPIAGTTSETVKKSTSVGTDAADVKDTAGKKGAVIETGGRKKDEVIETAGSQSATGSMTTMTAENDTVAAEVTNSGASAKKDSSVTDGKVGGSTDTKASAPSEVLGSTTTASATNTDAKVTPTADTKDAAKPATSKADDDVQKALAKIRGDNKDGADKDDDEEEDRYGGRKRYESFNSSRLNPSRNITDSPARRSFGVTK